MIGDISDNEALDGTRSSTGLQLLNSVISQKNLEEFFAFMIDTVAYTPLASQYEYTIGRTNVANPTVDIDADRPSKLLRVYTRYRPSGSVSGEIMLVAPQDLMMFRQDSVSLPTRCAYESAYPHAKIVFNTQLDTNYELVLNYSRNLPSVAFNDDLEVPPEYEPSLKYSLAYLLANRYGKDDAIKYSMKELRNEAEAGIRSNTAAKTPLMAHFGSDVSGNNIMHMSRYGL
jgi:hypothetical protein